MQTVRLKPSRKSRVLDEYDVDYLALELDDSGHVEDMRLELGSGYEIVWLIPIEPNGRMRLIRVEYVTVEIDPVLLVDDCGVDYSDSWRGELEKVGGEGMLDEVELSMTSTPPFYHCRAVVRRADGRRETFVLRNGGQ